MNPTQQTEKILQEKIRIIPHKNSCGASIVNKKTNNIMISCGDDLGGNNNEFYQCPECRDKDFQEYWFNKGYKKAQAQTLLETYKEFVEFLKEADKIVHSF